MYVYVWMTGQEDKDGHCKASNVQRVYNDKERK